MHASLLMIVVAIVGAFTFSSLWYTVFGKARMALLDNKFNASADVRKVPLRQILFELLRSSIVVETVSHLLHISNLHSWRQGIFELGLWLGIFPVMILLGATLWDKRPWKLSAIHGGDWIIKILLVTIILTV